MRIRQRQGRGRGAALTHGRIERRTIQVLPAPEKINFPHAARALGHPERAALRHLRRGRFPRPHRLWTPRHGLAIAVLRRAGHTNIAECLRWASYNFNHPLTLLASPDFAGALRLDRTGADLPVTPGPGSATYLTEVTRAPVEGVLTLTLLITRSDRMPENDPGA